MAEPSDNANGLEGAAGDARLAELAEGARRGDRAAAAEMLRALQDTIFRFAMSQLADRDAASDATQETALRLLKGVRGYRGEGRVSTWALGVTLNVCRERRRRRRLDGDDEALAAAPANAEPVGVRIESAEDAQQLRAAIDQLAPRQREAVVLRYFEQLSVAETARAMDCPVGTAKATLWQALRRLRSRLAVTETETTK